MNKLLCIALAAVFVIFLALGIVLNAQQGLYFEEDDFWKRKSDGRYQHGRDWIMPLSEDRFELFLGGKTITATRSTTPEGGIRMDYSDGWAVERSEEDDYLHVFGHYAWTNDSDLILTDMDAAGLQFAAPDHEERTPFHVVYDDADEAFAGETVELFSADGYLLDSYEVWPEEPAQHASEREIIILQNGTRMDPYPGYYDNILVNADGEYLLDAYNLGMIPLTGNSISRSSFTYFLLRIGEGAVEARGDATPVFCYILFYCLGALQLLIPEKLAFFGSRWQYREEPHLSDAGLLAARAIGGFIMFMGILMLFVTL